MNFEFHNPTHLVFGAGALSRLGEVVSKHGKKALIVTGGGSVKRNGTFDRAVASLKGTDVSVTECSGVEPNPRITTVRRGAQIARDESCDVIIALLGGGSTMDASKVMAAAFYYDGDPWDMICHGQPDPYVPTRALPIITVPTLAATGSEMNMGAVISNEETKEKSFVQTECLYPRVALVDPELTVSVPKDQTAYGVCDLITHVTEGYFNGVDSTPIQDRFAEGVILTAMEWGPKAIADGNDLADPGSMGIHCRPQRLGERGHQRGLPRTHDRAYPVRLSRRHPRGRSGCGQSFMDAVFRQGPSSQICAVCRTHFRTQGQRPR
jgi:alcohol dehydrogenase YqhD (iron-dependent ADH family)